MFWSAMFWLLGPMLDLLFETVIESAGANVGPLVSGPVRSSNSQKSRNLISAAATLLDQTPELPKCSSLDSGDWLEGRFRGRSAILWFHPGSPADGVYTSEKIELADGDCFMAMLACESPFDFAIKEVELSFCGDDPEALTAWERRDEIRRPIVALLRTHLLNSVDIDLSSVRAIRKSNSPWSGMSAVLHKLQAILDNLDELANALENKQSVRENHPL